MKEVHCMNCYTEGDNKFIVYDEHSYLWIAAELEPLFKKCGLVLDKNVFQDIDNTTNVKFAFTITDPECFIMLKLQIIK